MSRVCHILQPNRKQFFPYHFIFFDTETIPHKITDDMFEHRFRLGVGVYWCPKNKNKNKSEQWFNFQKPGELFDFIEHKAYKNKTLYVIAHNIDFDMKVLSGFQEMRDRKYNLKLFINNSIVKIWRYSRDKKRIVFLDNLNFFTLKLKQLGKDIGFNKLEMPSFNSSDKEWFKYCRRDVEILLEIWKHYLNFLKDNDLGSFQPTIASQAFAAFRHRFMKHKIYIHNSQKVIDFERESYHGARVECFYIGKTPKQKYYLLDVNSMYSYVMLKNEYPVRYISFDKNVSFFLLKRWLNKFSVIARVLLKTTKPIFPTKINSKLCFPIGSFESVLTTNELKCALNKGYIKKILQACVYERAGIFKPYIDYFYKKKIEQKMIGNSTYYYLSKLFLNSLYGKFGQKNDVWVQIDLDTELENGYYEEWDIEEQVLRKFRVVEGVVEESKGEREAYNSFPAIASEVTANARLYLWELIERANIKNVYYCDTDSLIVNETGFFNLYPLIDNNKLGYLKIEKISDDLEIFAPKYYRLGDRLKIKGISKSAKKLKDFTYEQWQFMSVKGALRKDSINRQLMIKIKKSLKRDYQKGRLLKSGRVLPYHLK